MNKQVSAEELKVGIGLKTWFGKHTIVELKKYNGPFDFVLCIAKFSNGTEMSIEKGQMYELAY